MDNAADTKTKTADNAVERDAPLGEDSLRAAVAAWEHSNQAQWRTAEYAAKIYGYYTPFATLALANGISRSADTVGNLAKAWVAYESARDHAQAYMGDESAMRVEEARNTFGYTHFVVLYRHLKAEARDPSDLISDFLEAADARIGTRKLDAVLSGKAKFGGVPTPDEPPSLPKGVYRHPVWGSADTTLAAALATGNYDVVLIPKDESGEATEVDVRYVKK